MSTTAKFNSTQHFAPPADCRNDHLARTEICECPVSTHCRHSTGLGLTAQADHLRTFRPAHESRFCTADLAGWSVNPARLTLPVSFTQLALENLARRVARQTVDEVDR